MRQTAPQIIIAGSDQSLDFLSINELFAHRLRVDQELLAARRIDAGWPPENVSAPNACIIPFPNASPKDIPLLRASVRLLDAVISARTGVRHRTLV